MKDLAGRTVLLTGASTGLGPHIARRLHRAGARFVLSARNEASLTRLAKELGDSRVVVADLSKAGEPERLAREAGAVDVLVSNAGVPASGRLASFEIEEIDRAIAVNLRAGIVLAAISPTFVSDAGMWAETGLKANPIAGEVTPEQVAEAVFTAITKNKAEIDVVRLPLRASLKVLAVAPNLFMAVARSSGATADADQAGERQRNKR